MLGKRAIHPRDFGRPLQGQRILTIPRLESLRANRFDTLDHVGRKHDAADRRGGNMIVTNTRTTAETPRVAQRDTAMPALDAGLQISGRRR